MRILRRKPGYLRCGIRWVPRVLGILALMVLGGVQPAMAESADADTSKAVSQPRGAMLRSLALPGWGQFYNGRPIKGSVIAVAEVGSVVAFFVRRHQIQTGAQTAPQRNVYFFTTIGMILYSMVDAYVDAHLDNVDWEGVEADVEGGRGEVRVNLRFRF